MLNFLFMKDFKIETEEQPKIADASSQEVLKVALTGFKGCFNEN